MRSNVANIMSCHLVFRIGIQQNRSYHEIDAQSSSSEGIHTIFFRYRLSDNNEIIMHLYGRKIAATYFHFDEARHIPLNRMG